MEALAYEKSKQKEKAKARYDEIIAASKSERRQITDLITALALKKTSRSDEGERLLREWMEKQPENKIARWAYAAYMGERMEIDSEGNGNLRIIREVLSNQ
jgi:hypothetical protein